MLSNVKSKIKFNFCIQINWKKKFSCKKIISLETLPVELLEWFYQSRTEAETK